MAVLQYNFIYKNISWAGFVHQAVSSNRWAGIPFHLYLFLAVICCCCSVVSDSLWPHGPQHARLPCLHRLLEIVWLLVCIYQTDITMPLTRFRGRSGPRHKLSRIRLYNCHLSAASSRTVCPRRAFSVCRSLPLPSEFTLVLT